MSKSEKIIIANQIEALIPECFERNLEKYWNSDYRIKEKILDNVYFRTSDDDAELNFTFVNEQLKAKDMSEVMQNLYNIFSRLVPGFSKIEVLGSKVNGIESGSIQYKSNALTYDLYNMYVVYNLKDKKLSFNGYCKYDQAEKWKEIFFEIAESVRKIDKM